MTEVEIIPASHHDGPEARLLRKRSLELNEYAGWAGVAIEIRSTPAFRSFLDNIATASDAELNLESKKATSPAAFKKMLEVLRMNAIDGIPSYPIDIDESPRSELMMKLFDRAFCESNDMLLRPGPIKSRMDAAITMLKAMHDYDSFREEAMFDNIIRIVNGRPYGGVLVVCGATHCRPLLRALLDTGYDVDLAGGRMLSSNVDYGNIIFEARESAVALGSYQDCDGRSELKIARFVLAMDFGIPAAPDIIKVSSMAEAENMRRERMYLITKLYRPALPDRGLARLKSAAGY